MTPQNTFQPIRLILARRAGFCRGVNRAVSEAYRLSEPELISALPLYMYGEIIHNSGVVNALLERGIVLAHDIGSIPQGARVLIRAHGISPQERSQMQRRDLEIIDCTCGYVHRIHLLVREAAHAGKTVIIVGNPNHPEVRGISGEADDRFYILSDPEEVDLLPPLEKNVIVVAQTTWSVEKFRQICKKLEKMITTIEIFDTICSATLARQEEVAEIAHSADLMMIIGAANSSNTLKLVDLSRAVCPKTYLVQNPSEVEGILANSEHPISVIGLSSGASAPEDLIDSVRQRIIDYYTANRRKISCEYNKQAKSNMIGNRFRNTY
ncbi:MAG: 4-hydroxy-3-methylbut-2-enyl diphosphate reductase [Clostridiaceae bacterium]|nr:4-hydroxy-3-methylbut-2-enyl diphosphate reductase [Clostridiaceae bacterium]